LNRRQVLGESSLPTRSTERALPKEFRRRELDRRVLAKSSRTDASRYRRKDALTGHGDGLIEDLTDASPRRLADALLSIPARLLTHRRIELLVIPLSRLPTVPSDRTHRLCYSRRNGKSIQQSVNRRRTPFASHDDSDRRSTADLYSDASSSALELTGFPRISDDKRTSVSH